MDQIHLYAFETLGYWTIWVDVADVGDDGETRRSMLYRGTHVPIDDEDPEVRAVLILHQVESDLNQAIRGELDTLAERPAGH